MWRTALLARLDQLLIADRVDRWVVVTGGPGMGKSAVLARWLTRRENASDLVPHHFIRRGEYNWDDPTTLVDSLVAQIATRFPDPCDPEAAARVHAAARLDATLRRVSKNELGPRGERLAVLITIASTNTMRRRGHWVWRRGTRSPRCKPRRRGARMRGDAGRAACGLGLE